MDTHPQRTYPSIHVRAVALLAVFLLLVSFVGCAKRHEVTIESDNSEDYDKQNSTSVDIQSDPEKSKAYKDMKTSYNEVVACDDSITCMIIEFNDSISIVNFSGIGGIVELATVVKTTQDRIKWQLYKKDRTISMLRETMKGKIKNYNEKEKIYKALEDSIGRGITVEARSMRDSVDIIEDNSNNYLSRFDDDEILRLLRNMTTYCGLEKDSRRALGLLVASRENLESSKRVLQKEKDAINRLMPALDRFNVSERWYHMNELERRIKECEKSLENEQVNNGEGTIGEGPIQDGNISNVDEIIYIGTGIFGQYESNIRFALRQIEIAPESSEAQRLMLDLFEQYSNRLWSEELYEAYVFLLSQIVPYPEFAENDTLQTRALLLIRDARRRIQTGPAEAIQQATHYLGEEFVGGDR